MKLHYCWHCDKEVPMLEEGEWARIEPLLWNHKDNIRRIHKELGCDLNAASRIVDQEICDLHFEITGQRVKISSLMHHRLADYGPECSGCGRLFRSKEDTLCDNCGGTKDGLIVAEL